MKIDKDSGRDARNDDEQMFEQLFAHAKARPQPPVDDMEEVRRAVFAEWDAVTGRRARWQRVVAIAATFAAVAFVLWTTVDLAPTVPAPVVARVERVQGVIGMRLGDEVAGGATIATGGGQLALRLASGGSLRLAPQTRLELTAADAAALTAGMVYFDSEGARGGAPFTIATTLGNVRDVGTQFLVRVDAEQLAVGVRDGRVALEAGTQRSEAAAGDRLVLAAAGGLRRDAIAAVGDEWEWAEKLAPPFEIDGRRLSEFLAWFTAQTGRTVVFADANAERIARDTVLSGAIDLEPLPKLAAVLALADLGYRLDGNRVVIASR